MLGRFTRDRGQSSEQSTYRVDKQSTRNNKEKSFVPEMKTKRQNSSEKTNHFL